MILGSTPSEKECLASKEKLYMTTIREIERSTFAVV